MLAVRQDTGRPLVMYLFQNKTYISGLVTTVLPYGDPACPSYRVGLVTAFDWQNPDGSVGTRVLHHAVIIPPGIRTEDDDGYPTAYVPSQGDWLHVDGHIDQREITRDGKPYTETYIIAERTVLRSDVWPETVGLPFKNARTEGLCKKY